MRLSLPLCCLFLAVLLCAVYTFSQFHSFTAMCASFPHLKKNSLECCLYPLSRMCFIFSLTRCFGYSPYSSVVLFSICSLVFLCFCPSLSCCPRVCLSLFQLKIYSFSLNSDMCFSPFCCCRPFVNVVPILVVLFLAVLLSSDLPICSAYFCSPRLSVLFALSSFSFSCSILTVLRFYLHTNVIYGSARTYTSQVGRPQPQIGYCEMAKTMGTQS